MYDRINISDEFVGFSIQIIKTFEKTTSNIIQNNIVNQLVRSATSSGANYHEACSAQSQADFIHKLHITYKELNETIYWLKICLNINLINKEDSNILIERAHRLIRITAASLKTAKRNQSLKKP